MRLSLIVAVARNGVIGNQGQLPWRLSADLKRFKSLTMGHHLIMGRKTFTSIPGLLLPGRISLVLKRRSSPYDWDFYDSEGRRRRWYKEPYDPANLDLSPGEPLPLAFVHNLDEALRLASEDDEAFVIGGAEVFQTALPRADRLYITWVEADVEGDVYLPPIDLSQWRVVEETALPADAKNEYPTRFCVYNRER